MCTYYSSRLHTCLYFKMKATAIVFVGVVLLSWLTVVNPANGQTIGHVADMTTADAENAITVAHQAFQTWRHKTGKVCPYTFAASCVHILSSYIVRTTVKVMLFCYCTGKKRTASQVVRADCAEFWWTSPSADHWNGTIVSLRCAWLYFFFQMSDIRNVRLIVAVHILFDATLHLISLDGTCIPAFFRENR